MTVVTLPTELGEASLISNSEVDSFLTCERKHLFSFVFEREAKKKSRSLSIGIVGHEVLAVYYRALQAGMNKGDAEKEAMRHLTGIFREDEYDPDSLATVYSLINRYISQDTLAGGTRILEVETDFYLPITEEYWYAMRLDLLVEALVGSLRGKVLLVDHKFTYDFYTEDDLQLNPQMPKYAAAVRHAGYPVYDAYINQIRTRFPAHLIEKKTSADLFSRMPVDLTVPRVRSALSHQMIISKRIIERRKMPIELQIEEAVPVLNKMICRNCPFKSACAMVEDGLPVEKALGPEYKIRKYGYSKEEIDGS